MCHCQQRQMRGGQEHVLEKPSFIQGLRQGPPRKWHCTGEGVRMYWVPPDEGTQVWMWGLSAALTQARWEWTVSSGLRRSGLGTAGREAEREVGEPGNKTWGLRGWLIYSSAVLQAALHPGANNMGGGREKGKTRGWEEASGEIQSSLGNSRLPRPSATLQTAYVYRAAPLSAPLPAWPVSASCSRSHSSASSCRFGLPFLPHH